MKRSTRPPHSPKSRSEVPAKRTSVRARRLTSWAPEEADQLRDSMEGAKRQNAGAPKDGPIAKAQRASTRPRPSRKPPDDAHLRALLELSGLDRMDDLAEVLAVHTGEDPETTKARLVRDYSRSVKPPSAKALTELADHEGEASREREEVLDTSSSVNFFGLQATSKYKKASVYWLRRNPRGSAY